MEKERTGLVAAFVILILAVAMVLYAYFSTWTFWANLVVFFVVPAFSFLLFAIYEWANPSGALNE